MLDSWQKINPNHTLVAIFYRHKMFNWGEQCKWVFVWLYYFVSCRLTTIYARATAVATFFRYATIDWFLCSSFSIAIHTGSWRWLLSSAFNLAAIIGFFNDKIRFNTQRSLTLSLCFRPPLYFVQDVFPSTRLSAMTLQTVSRETPDTPVLGITAAPGRCTGKVWSLWKTDILHHRYKTRTLPPAHRLPVGIFIYSLLAVNKLR